MDNTDLKAKFKQGKIPSEQDYSALIDSIPDTNKIVPYSGLSDTFKANIPADIEASFSDYKNKLLPNTDTFKILNLQDLHYSKRNNMGDTGYDSGTPIVLDQTNITKSLDSILDAVILNGDNVHGNEIPYLTNLRTQQVLSRIRSILPTPDLYVSIGNHDDNTVFKKATQDRITRDALLQVYDYPNHSFGETRPDNNPYCYKDYPRCKLRVINIAGFDNPDVYTDTNEVKYPRATSSVFTQHQLEWLISEALVVPNDYDTVIFNHSPLLGFSNNIPYSYMTNINHDIIIGIIKAFIAGSSYTGVGTNSDFPVNAVADFTTQGPRKLIGIFSGHEHRDSSEVQNIDGINSVVRTCNVCAGAQRKIGTVSQYGFDTIEINTNTKSVTFHRFGVGTDLSFSY